MTKKRLEEYRPLKGELELLNEKYDPFSLFSISEDAKQALGINVDKKISKIRRIRRDRAERVQKEISEIEHFIESIEDDFIRQVIELHYVQRLSYRVISKKLYGRTNPSTPAVMITRYLKRIGGATEHDYRG